MYENTNVHLMRRMKRVVAVLASTALLAVLPLQAEADDTQCVGALTGTFDNVIVPPGATCVLTDSVVLGNVKALERSRLLIRDSQVGGNVEGDKADIVQIFFSTVREYILIKEGGPAEPPAPQFNVCGFGMNFTPCEALILGTTLQEGGVHIEKMIGDVVVGRVDAPDNLKVEDNVITEILLIQNSTIGQNLQVFKNRGVGTKLVQSNTVGENLQCFENDPPFLGQGNTARQAEGQCATPPAP
jgi:hypothetical protein